MLDAISPLARVRVFQAFQQVQASISGGSLAGLVCECRDAYGDLLVRLAEKPQVPPVPTLVILRPVESDIISFTKMVRSGWPALARVAGESRGAEEVRAVVQHHWSPEASAPIVHRLFERSQLQPDVLLVIAMISGSKRLSVGAFARVAQLSERTLERRLAIARLPCARRLLAWATVLHSVWRLEVAGERVKEASVKAGFLTREAFTSFIRRHSGRPVSDLCQAGSFVEMLDTFLAELSTDPRFSMFGVIRNKVAGPALEPLIRSELS